MVVLAPIPSASVITATAVKPGFFSNWRMANFKSFISKNDNRIEPGCAARRKPAGQQRDHRQQEGNAHERHRVSWLDLVEKAGHKTCHSESSYEAEGGTEERQAHSMAKHELQHI